MYVMQNKTKHLIADMCWHSYAWCS